VIVVDADGKETIFPDLSERTVKVPVDYINSLVGIKESGDRLVELVRSMSLDASLVGQEIIVNVPPTRSDILHACDVMEDAAIAYNFNKIQETQPKFDTIAVQLPINKLADMIRREIAMSGYTEVLAFTLVLHI
jgi:phenylalanyl-tRNA synthetase beta chain